MHFYFVGFTDLSLNDQMRLLQGSWSEVLTLSLVFRTLPTSVAAANAAAKDTEAGGLLKRRLKFAPDFALTEAMALQIDLEEFHHHVSCSQNRERERREQRPWPFLLSFWPLQCKESTKTKGRTCRTLKIAFFTFCMKHGCFCHFFLMKTWGLTRTSRSRMKVFLESSLPKPFHSSFYLRLELTSLDECTQNWRLMH